MTTVRAIEQPFMVAFEECVVASAVAIATSFITADSVVDQLSLPGTTSRELISCNL